ncbi:cobalt ECF transporter T component CbiQ [Nocardioides sp. TRM66260-LWL]|uniref:cobalt ECF transporter T component CbiQ n=1 Tax=Nocardioides sp. TRM66260-LWL TaxID=2874478 RepID=UPI001CC46DB8|nr:cobalt ECF transporter T component CbiQ [Nocardioides sp. TRM66260-LWL]MBZ5732958.1 cobalt ECF transporter T component CbiQ [Nocardioides sp. TRM66260-LWL]
MGAGHGHRLHFHGHSALHRAAAHHKVLALLGFMLVVVATPRGWWWAYLAEGVLLGGVVLASRVPLGFLARRMVVETPVLVFAALLPLIAHGERVDVLGLSLSRSGLEGAALLLVKATFGVVAGLTLAATTEPQALLAGLARLRLPHQLVQIAAFMVRYLDVVTDEMRRMRVAREARGFTARDPRHWGVLARSVGALFIRSYERGERVHLAMLARGYDGRIPLDLDRPQAPAVAPRGHGHAHGHAHEHAAAPVPALLTAPAEHA